MPSFRADALSYLQFVGLRRSVMIFSDVELVFKPLAADGLLLQAYSADTRERQVGSTADPITQLMTVFCCTTVLRRTAPAISCRFSFATLPSRYATTSELDLLYWGECRQAFSALWLIIMLAVSSDKRNATVWRPSVRLCVRTVCMSSLFSNFNRACDA